MIREFDKIYVAKYKNILTIQQLAEDLRSNKQEIENILKELRVNGMDEVYKNISDYEWEMLEDLKDEEIKMKYYKYSSILQEKALKEIYKTFMISTKEFIRNFPKYNYTKKNFDRDYMQEEDYEGEEWKQIGDLSYVVSNYGRIKNTNTKKLKKLKFQFYGMQVILWQNSKSYTITISRLVAEMFIRHLESNERAIHINGNIRDN